MKRCGEIWIKSVERRRAIAFSLQYPFSALSSHTPVAGELHPSRTRLGRGAGPCCLPPPGLTPLVPPPPLPEQQHGWSSPRLGGEVEIQLIISCLQEVGKGAPRDGCAACLFGAGCEICLVDVPPCHLYSCV